MQLQRVLGLVGRIRRPDVQRARKFPTLLTPRARLWFTVLWLWFGLSGGCGNTGATCALAPSWTLPVGRPLPGEIRTAHDGSIVFVEGSSLIRVSSTGEIVSRVDVSDYSGVVALD